MKINQMLVIVLIAFSLPFTVYAQKKGPNKQAADNIMLAALAMAPKLMARAKDLYITKYECRALNAYKNNFEFRRNLDKHWRIVQARAKKTPKIVTLYSYANLGGYDFANKRYNISITPYGSITSDSFRPGFFINNNKCNWQVDGLNLSIKLKTIYEKSDVTGWFGVMPKTISFAANEKKAESLVNSVNNNPGLDLVTKSTWKLVKVNREPDPDLVVIVLTFKQTSPYQLFHPKTKQKLLELPLLK